MGRRRRALHTFQFYGTRPGSIDSLPIYGLFMKKVYADPALPYSQDMRFEFPSGINFCEKDYYGDYVDADNDAEEASFEGVFD